MKIRSLVIGLIILVGCSTKQRSDGHDMNNMKMDSNQMGDQVRRDSIDSSHNMAGMQMDIKNPEESGNDSVQLSDQQIQLGNIRTDTVKHGMLGDQLILTGTISLDQNKMSTVSARVMGRIDKLYFKNTGEYIRKGMKLFDIYSEELNNAKQELILALDKRNSIDNGVIDFDQLIKSAKNKLLLWGMNESQISDIIRDRNTRLATTFYSPASGYLTSLDAREGDYVMEGRAVVHLTELSSVWVEAQVYASQLSQIEKSSAISVKIPGVFRNEIKGSIEFVNPEITSDTRINLIRISIPNPGNNIKPGMPAYVIIKTPQHKTFSLPADAVIRNGYGALVWIKTGPHTFKNKMVTIGMEMDDRIEIRSGINNGDIVVISGAYLINSEYIFKQGANPMSGMKM